MTEWVMVNGARIKRSILQELVAEALEYKWEQTHWDKVGDHGHCMVCGVTLSGSDPCSRSEGGWLCPYCFETFVAREGAI